MCLHLLISVSRVGLKCRTLGMAALNTARLYDYPGGVKRFHVPDDKVSWSMDWPEYKPVDYTAPPVLAGPVWADPDFRSESMI